MRYPSPVDRLLEFEVLRGRNIISLARASIDQAFAFSQQYWNCFEQTESLIRIIATPGCTEHHLHELILENSYKPVPFAELPRTISALRRLTWGLMQIPPDSMKRGFIVAIAEAQRLNPKALEEVEDLNLRHRVTFLLGSSLEYYKLSDLNEQFKKYSYFQIPKLQEILQLENYIDELDKPDLSIKDVLLQVNEKYYPPEKEEELETIERYSRIEEW